MRKLLAKILVGAVLAMALLLLGSDTLYAGSQTQPILFNHKIHAGDYQVACLYCHSYARRSIIGGIPSVRKCMGCHKIVATDKPEIQKLQKYWGDGESIPWVRIHKLPDHVQFNHRRHVLKEVKCQECHGPVETMAEVTQVSSLKMGWCLTCHKQRNVSIDCYTCHR